MKVTELMIDDWVEFTSKYGYGTGQIAGIEPREGAVEPTSFTVLKKDKEGNTQLFIGVRKNCINPIPLTQEVLEKNGWIWNDLPFEQYWSQYGLNLYFGGNGYRINCGSNVSMVIDFVHQLQHALKLCGIDKTIEI